MGGSAASGDLVSALADLSGTRPVYVVRQYEVPAWLPGNAWCWTTSYSGNTEETLAAAEALKARGITAWRLCSGGRLASDFDGPICRVPGGNQPRMALGLMLIPILRELIRAGCLPQHDFAASFANLQALAQKWAPEGQDPLAKDLARHLAGSIPILYGVGRLAEALTRRWKGQINENAKVLTVNNGYPELNHNEILVWESAPLAKYAGIRIQTSTEPSRNTLRALETERLSADKVPTKVAHVPGDNFVDQGLGSVLLADFVSLYLAALLEVDPVTIHSIDHLKAHLSKN